MKYKLTVEFDYEWDDDRATQPQATLNYLIEEMSMYKTIECPAMLLRLSDEVAKTVIIEEV